MGLNPFLESHLDFEKLCELLIQSHYIEVAQEGVSSNLTFFLPMKTWKNQPQKLLIIGPKFLFQSTISPNLIFCSIKIGTHKNGSLRNFYIMTLFSSHLTNSSDSFTNFIIMNLRIFSTKRECCYLHYQYKGINKQTREKFVVTKNLSNHLMNLMIVLQIYHPEFIISTNL